MATVALIPVEEYLTTSYRPDCDYIDGVVEERNLGEYEHGRLQLAIGAVFLTHEARWDLKAITEQRVRIRDGVYRVPDVCVIRACDRKPVITTAPRLCIEILSACDTLSRLRAKLQDYLDLGVPESWVFDPRTRLVWVCNSAGLSEYRGEKLTVPGTELDVVLASVFAALD